MREHRAASQQGSVNLEKVALDGARVRLEPLAQRHLEGLAEAIRDGELWRIPVTLVPHPEELPSFLDDAETGFAAGKVLVFATIDKITGKIAGSTRFLDYVAPHKRVEIGFTFLGRQWQRSHVNTEAKLLMLSLAFERWGLNRVALLTDVRNTASRRAIERLGALPEGLLRSHMVMRDGCLRDSAVYAITKEDWPSVKSAINDKINQ